MKSILLLALGLLLAGTTWFAAQLGQQPATQNPGAQSSAVIEGTVFRAASGQPLKGTRVTLTRSNGAQNGLPAALSGGLGQGRVAIAAIAGATGSAVTVTTDATGKFKLTRVAPGQYRISAERDGFIRSEYGQRTPTGEGIVVSIAANQDLMIDLSMLQASVMSGRVLTEDGEPAPNHTVSAYAYQYANGERSLAQVATAQTNDLGEYRLYWLDPGEYFVSVSNDFSTGENNVGTVDVSQARGRGNVQGIQALAAAFGGRGGVLGEALDTGNPPIYYPSTLDPDSAVPISVPAAAEVRGVDFNLRPMQSATVSGRVAAPFPLNTTTEVTAGVRGRGGNGPTAAPTFRIANSLVQINLTRIGAARTGLGALIGLRLGLTPVNPDGTFEIRGVAPGEYNLTATARDPNGQDYSARTRVTVGTADVANVVATLRPGVAIAGRILAAGSVPPQFRMSNLRVSLVPEDGGGGGILNFSVANRGNGGINFATGGSPAVSAPVGDDGTFTLGNVGASEYRVRVTGLPAGAYVQAGRIGTQDALDAPFSVEDGQALLQLQIAFTSGRVSGLVTDARGLPAPGAQAVLVPDEARRGRGDLYFNVTTSQEGQFAFNNVPPGNYKLFAWEAVPDGAYQYPDFIRRYEDRGQILTVAPNGNTQAEGKLITAS